MNRSCKSMFFIGAVVAAIPLAASNADAVTFADWGGATSCFWSTDDPVPSGWAAGKIYMDYSGHQGMRFKASATATARYARLMCPYNDRYHEHLLPDGNVVGDYALGSAVKSVTLKFYNDSTAPGTKCAGGHCGTAAMACGITPDLQAYACGTMKWETGTGYHGMEFTTSDELYGFRITNSVQYNYVWVTIMTALGASSSDTTSFYGMDIWGQY